VITFPNCFINSNVKPPDRIKAVNLVLTHVQKFWGELMKILFTVLLACLISTAAYATISKKDIAGIKAETQKQGITIEDYPDAHQELKEQVEACGLGVVEGWKGENRCTHTIEVDDWFLRPHCSYRTMCSKKKEWFER
jgi:cell division protein FtsL